MGNLANKGISLIIQIIFVVGLVLVFSWFDPFDMLSSSHVKLKNTPIQVHSIKEIGQLVTAEYYGEVIASLKEVIKEEEFVQAQKYDTSIDNLHTDFQSAIKEFSSCTFQYSSSKDIYNHFIDSYDEFIDNHMFFEYLYFIREELMNNDYSKNEKDKVLNYRRKTRLFMKLYLNTDNWLDTLMKLETDEFITLNLEEQKKNSKNKYKNSRLAIIGRGWVKAGFDFGEFTEYNFIYHENTKRIHLIGLYPKILVKTINPWFIPEEGIEGFEFLIVERGARLEYEYTKRVKQLCLNKLVSQAMKGNILEKAKSNAEVQLKQFFSIITGKDIAGVYFHANYLDYTLEELLSQSKMIRNDNIANIDSAITHYAINYSHEKDQDLKLEKFIDTLCNLTTTIYGDTIQLNNYSSLLYTILKDRTFDTNDIKLIRNRKPKLSDTLWLSNFLSDDSVYSKGRLLNENDKLIIDSIFQSNFNTFCTDLRRVLTLWHINDTTIFPSNDTTAICKPDSRTITRKSQDVKSEKN